ncbi:hypothetical protein O7635_29645 [Asanoa sp. WMMD1127]|uniref:hypothetical protein n=1 Tax=Asanoa sp. WMMD1127 TaxID=3016107 RepID=UPI0024160A01|nr:hypothetical protein [Asanoa sp. WMMD1127]MDG4826033.1 hypothetical protein [Asanoa sp. WMMD1127]
MSNPTDLIEPYRAHRLYGAAYGAIKMAEAQEGEFAALFLANRIRIEFEEVTLRETANRIRLTMEEAPESTKGDCE